MSGFHRVVRLLSLCCLLAAVPFVAGTAHADWPQFLGPRRDGIAHDAKGLARSWPAGGPRKVWSIPVGRGYGGAAIHGDSVLLLDRDGNSGDVLRRLRLADGKETWRFAYSASGQVQYPGSRSTPATDGDLIFTVGPFGHIHAVNFADGKPVWKAHLLRDWQAKRPQWGVATSPLLLGDLVIVAPWGRKAALVAYNKKTGQVAWTTPNPRGVIQEYQSPVPMTLCGKQMVVASGRRGFVIGADARSGQQLWEYGGYVKTGWNIPSPIAAGNDQVLITGGYKCGSAMIKIVRAAGGYAARQIWKNNNMGSHIAQALVHGGNIYVNSIDFGGGLRCLGLDGQIRWNSRANRRRFERGNLIIADGLIFVADGRKGQIYMVEATPEGYKELAHTAILKGPQVWAPMAYADGKLIVRDLNKVVCLDVKAGG